MKLKFLFNFVTLLFILFSNAQEKIEATIIKTDGIKLKGLVSSYQGNVASGQIIKIWVDGEKIKINRDDISTLNTGSRSYSVITFDKISRRGNQIKTKRVRRLAEILIDGDINLYAIYYIRANGYTNASGFFTSTGSYLETSHYVKDEANKIIRINKTSFKKTIKKVFPDCKKLLLQVKTKKIKYDEIVEAINKGNDCIKSN
ncbi:hypothetical protein ACKGJY_10795 [Hyunsoonleella sp. 2307UL5-6]|uniref:hypothetical protein n=1 Tax=Hyunsoonleella sp. 2307UL5-6 TaxID=3384768 RepID=UPI0039BD549A